MSLISTLHAVQEFDSKKSKPLDGQRLARVIYKGRNGKVVPTSKCVSVPLFTESEVRESIDSLLPHLVELCESAQDKLIRGLVDSGKKEISQEDIGLTQVIKYLEANSTSGGHLSAERIASWFTQNLAESLTVAFADRLGISDTPTEGEVKKLEQILKGYSDSLSELAGKKVVLSTEKAQKLKKALEFADENDVFATRLEARIDEVSREVKEDLMGL